MKLEIKDIVWLHRLLSKPLELYTDGCGCCSSDSLSSLHDGDDDFEKRRKAILKSLTIPEGGSDEHTD